MKPGLLALFFALSVMACTPTVADVSTVGNATEPQILDLEPTQSMAITGLGPGQDAAINPYTNQRSKALVANIGKADLTVRVQKQGEIIDLLKIQPRRNLEVVLEEGYEIYFDCEADTRAKVAFKPAR